MKVFGGRFPCPLPSKGCYIHWWSPTNVPDPDPGRHWWTKLKWHPDRFLLNDVPEIIGKKLPDFEQWLLKLEITLHITSRLSSAGGGELISLDKCGPGCHGDMGQQWPGHWCSVMWHQWSMSRSDYCTQVWSGAGSTSIAETSGKNNSSGAKNLD